MSWEEVDAEIRRWAADRREGNRPLQPPARAEDHSPQEIIDEIALILADVVRLRAERPDHPDWAYMTAHSLATMRDESRSRPALSAGLGHVASLIAGWLVRRADGDYGASLEAARVAASRPAVAAGLARELREFVAGHLDGSISGEEFVRQLKTPSVTPGRLAAHPPHRGPHAIALGSVESVLRSMLADAGAPGSRREVRAVWEVFRRFAVLPVVAAEPERLDEPDGDLLLFQWTGRPSLSVGDQQSVSSVDLVRQFSILDGDGDYDRKEQLRMSITMDLSREFGELESGSVWSGDDREGWFTEVEQSAAFAGLISHRLARHVDVEHEVV